MRNLSPSRLGHPRRCTAVFWRWRHWDGAHRTADPDNLPEERIPRNSQALFNLEAREFSVMFHDGRLEVDPK